MQRQGFRVTEKSTRRQHDSEQEIDDLVARFDDLALPKREWTHFAHLTVGFCSLERFGLTAARLLLPDRIRRYNVASGTPNTDSGGNHDPITMVFLAAAARFRSQLPRPADRSPSLGWRRVFDHRLLDRPEDRVAYTVEHLD